MEPVAFVSDKIRGFTKSTQELFGSLVQGRPQPSARRHPNSWPAKSTRVGIDLSECPPSLAKASYTANGSNWLSAIAIPVGAQCRDVAVITSPLTRGRALLIFHHLGHWQCNWLNGEKNQMLLLPWLSLFLYWQCNRVQVKAAIQTMSSERKITLKSSDGETFEVDEAVALESQTIKHMVEDDCADNGIPLPNVTSKILAKVIEYCRKHVEAAKPEERPAVDEDLKAWDAEFVKVDQATLFDLILAANYLNIKSLLDLTCQTVADMIKGKTPEEIRKTFNIKNDFTPEEEEEVRRENQWAFE
ncbi:hypothetical protein ACFX2I_016034 [Malus domestica]